jgi:predicted ArsR family transcriptional regulator
MTGSTAVHRVLGDPTRARVVESLRRSERPLSSGEIAGELGVHVNTVRTHLARLESVGLVCSENERRDGPGRPCRLFSVRRDPAEDEHALLAAALASALDPIAEGPSLAEAAGRGWGHRLASSLGPSADTAVERVQGVLVARGFEPERSSEGIAMHRCPFRELASRHAGVICGFHAGLIAGALDELESDCTLDELRPWVTSDTCLAVLKPKTRATTRVG